MSSVAKKDVDKRAILMRLIDERPKRKVAEGHIVVHFDRAGRIRKIEDVVPCLIS